MAQDRMPQNQRSRIGTKRDQPLMPIGMFSRAALLSVKALRAYHDQGILIPASIDEDTGYRSYHPGQLSDAAILSRLRRLDLPLAQVKEILLARDPEVTRKVLAQHHLLMSERLSETERIVEELQRAVSMPLEQTPVHVRTLDHQFALAVSGVLSSEDFSSFLGDAFALLYESANSLGFTMTGPGAALYAPIIHDHDAEPVTAYIPVDGPQVIPEPTRGLSVIELPQQRAAVIVHRGSYQSIGETYASLGAWVAHDSATRPQEPISLNTGSAVHNDGATSIREIYTVSIPHTEDPAAYRTEICWPI